MTKNRAIQALIMVSLLVTLLALAACAQGVVEITPPEIHYGEDLCAECTMIISDPRFAAAYVHEVGPGRYQSIAFDDIGDMLIHAGKHPEHTVVRWYVHDYTTEEWLDATEAHFVFSNQLKTPMAHGTAAHTSLASAEAMAAELNGEVLDWNGLLARYQAGEATFDVDVSRSKLHGSFMAPGDGRLFLAPVAPAAPQVGRQPLELLAFEKAGMMEWPVLDDLTPEITFEL